MAQAKQRNKNYVDPKAFYDALKDYKALCKKAEEKGKPKPRIPEFIGECIWKIATNFATRPEYNRYAYKEDMIGDAVIQCIKYLHNFDPERSKSAFSYFTQCCYHSFIHRIDLEKDQLYIKVKSIVELPVEGRIAHTDSDDHSMDNIDMSFSNMHDFIGDYERKKNITHGKRTRKRSSSLDDNSKSALESFSEPTGAK